MKKFPMNETNFSEIGLADQNQDEYKHLRNTAAFIIEGVLLPILATFGIVGKSVRLLKITSWQTHDQKAKFLLFF